MKYNISIARDIAKLCNTCIGYILFFITTLYIYKNCIPTPLWLLGIPLILICNKCIQNYCFQPVLYVLLHGIVWIPVCLIPFAHMEYRYLFLVLLFLEFMNAIHVWRTPTEKEYNEVPWQIILWVTILYIITSAYDMHNIATIIYYIGVLVLLLHFIRLFIAGINRLLTKADQATSMPIRKILLTNILIFIFFLTTIAVTTIVSFYSDADRLFVALGDGLVRLIRLIIRVVSLVITVISALFAKDRKTNIPDAREQLDNSWRAIKEPSLLAQILDGIIMIIAIFIVIYIIYRIIVKFIKIFTKRYSTDTDVVVRLSKPQKSSHVKKARTPFYEHLKEFFSNDNVTKIRRGYRVTIKGYRLPDLHQSDTPITIADKVNTTLDKDISALTNVYEKARYSSEEITYEDVQKGGFL